MTYRSTGAWQCSTFCALLLGAVWHNWRFFAKRIWGEEVTIPAE